MASLEQSISVLSQGLNLRATRHQILASNIANADTPGYKARDFQFDAAMKNAMAGRPGSATEVARTSSAHLSGVGGAGPVNMAFRTVNQSSVDGNTVDMDVERTQITDNALQYQILTQLIGDKFKGMRTALSSNNS
jgi:flagellar basal-body rod protein FlgB